MRSRMGDKYDRGAVPVGPISSPSSFKSYSASQCSSTASAEAAAAAVAAGLPVAADTVAAETVAGPTAVGAGACDKGRAAAVVGAAVAEAVASGSRANAAAGAGAAVDEVPHASLGTDAGRTTAIGFVAPPDWRKVVALAAFDRPASGTNAAAAELCATAPGRAGARAGADDDWGAAAVRAPRGELGRRLAVDESRFDVCVSLWLLVPLDCGGVAVSPFCADCPDSLAAPSLTVASRLPA